MMTKFNSALLAMFAALTMIASSAFAGSYSDKKKMAAEQNIVEIAAGNETFSTLVAALQAGDLVETLQGDGPFTVFAPTDEAFAKLPEGTLENLLKPENKDQLVSVLTYHVVAGKVMAKDVAGLDSATTVQGTDVSVATDYGKVKINDATVVTADISASNGVIHVIDTVILPASQLTDW